MQVSVDTCMCEDVKWTYALGFQNEWTTFECWKHQRIRIFLTRSISNNHIWTISTQILLEIAVKLVDRFTLTRFEQKRSDSA